jgi:formylmethanofuran dehydrogenase subunit E-like metal-binding protein
MDGKGVRTLPNVRANKENKMRRIVGIGFTAILFFTVGWCPHGLAANFESMVSRAMQALEVSKNDPNMLILTNATYVRENGASMLNWLDQAQKQSGCTVGKGNLLFFQRPQAHPLRMMLFSKKDGHAVIFSREKNKWESDDLNLGPAIISRADFRKKTNSYHAGRDIGSMATIANVWAKDGPYDFLKCAELHNHICPGVTSGYFIAHYILDHFPLKPGERYTVIACPVWCKEDAFQVVMDCTPGKKGMVVKRLSEAQKKRISVANPAGMVLIWDAKQKRGRGAALSFSFDPLRALSPNNSTKPAIVLSALEYMDQPDRFVSTAAEFNLDEKLYDAIVQAGNNPWEVVGLTKN